MGSRSKKLDLIIALSSAWISGACTLGAIVGFATFGFYGGLVIEILFAVLFGCSGSAIAFDTILEHRPKAEGGK